HPPRPLKAHPAAGTLRAVLLLAPPPPGAPPPPPAHPPPPRRRGEGLLAPPRHPRRHHGGGARGPVVGSGRQDLRAPRALLPALLGGARADPLLLRLSRVAAVVGIGHAVAHHHARVRPRLVLRRRPHAPHA